MNNFENISIDKIVILFNAPSFKGDDYVRKYWKRFDQMIDSGRPVPMGATQLYQYAAKWFSDFYIQWGAIQSRIQTIRIEFNPNKCDLNYLPAFFALLKSHSFQFARVSRLDIAIDYFRYLNPLCWRCANTRKKNHFLDGDLLKTLYFGASSSDLQIRVYDKSFELKEKIGLDLGTDFWRVEAQIKGIGGEPFNLIDDQHVSSFNPFDRLSFYDQFGFKPEGQGAYNAFVYLARAYGISFAASLYHKQTKDKYLAQLKQDTAALPFHEPAEIYRNCFNSVYVRLVNRLFDLFQKGQTFSPKLGV
ncbi:MAG: hypothetical protein PHE96_11295 [Methylococcales bacterium]|nr:hypothetical protein [Methylococcales bacterium]